MKSKQFYSQFSNGTPRRYFYNVDLQGRLFLEETHPKNIATSIKDEKFLNFFFSRVRWANNTATSELEFLKEHDANQDYPFVSKCGLEMNFIRPASMPIVFHSLTNNTLFYGGSLGIPFESDRLAISKTSGKMYYKISDTTTCSSSRNPNKIIDYGLLCASVGIQLSNKISIIDERHEERFLFDDAEIDWLPPYCEPGKWALPG